MGMDRNHTLTLLFLITLVAQIGFWTHSRTVKPELGIVPDVPGKAAVKALSFGDEQAFFRLLGLQIQTSGDTFGRFTALYKYDFKKLRAWFSLLDELDNTSNYIPTMASYYFSQTQNRPDVKYVVDYLYEHSAYRPEIKWWWLVQAAYLANHKLDNKDLALKMVKPLEQTKNVPIWVKQMPAFIYEQRGEFDSALKIIEDIQKNYKDIPEGELNFMQYFVKERIKRLDDVQKSSDNKSSLNNPVQKE